MEGGGVGYRHIILVLKRALYTKLQMGHIHKFAEGILKQFMCCKQ